MLRRVALLMAFADACASHPRPRSNGPSAGRRRVVISVMGTNDLHGRIEMLPLLAGYVDNLRRARERDGALLLVDGGDMFQGTVESNLGEGAAVVRAYNAMGYAAVTIGNHEFDYGPAGEHSFARGPDEDPRGALRARAREARFPFLSANIVDSATRTTPAWDNVRPTLITTLAGVKVGLIGVGTESTPHTTLAANFRGLAMLPLAETIRARAQELRSQGAVVVIVLAHAGGSCRAFNDPDELRSCEADEEIFQVANALPEGGVDAIIAGHTHRGIAHVVHGIPVLESYCNGQSFGRIDLTVDRVAGRVLDRRVFRPQSVCGGRQQRDEPDPSSCSPDAYENAPVERSAAVEQAIAPALEAARAVRERPLGVRVESIVRSRYREESTLTNLVADMVRAAAPGADVAVVNSGGVRADLQPGPLDYGRLYAVLPFDNRLVRVRMRGAQLKRVLTDNVRTDSGILGISGARVVAACEGDRLTVSLARDDGRPIGDDELLTVATNDYLASGSFARHLAEPLTDDAIVASPTLRDAVAEVIASAQTLRGDDPRWFDPAHPRMRLPSPRPVRCR